MGAPYNDYILGKKVERDTGVVSGTDTKEKDTHQKYEVLEAGEGRTTETGAFVSVNVKPGDVVFVQKHADADTPQELKDKDQALFMASRIMYVEENHGY
jgi:co-chaperonin GroES (HSP10)